MFALIGGLGTVRGRCSARAGGAPGGTGARRLGASANGLHGFVYGTVLVLITLTLPGGLVGTFGRRITAWIDALPGGRAARATARPSPGGSRRHAGRAHPGGANLVKRFGGLTATDNVSLTLKRGEILGVIGPNGAGKTTVFNQLSGFLKPIPAPWR